jgi:hypothetical protein
MNYRTIINIKDLPLRYLRSLQTEELSMNQHEQLSQQEEVRNELRNGGAGDLVGVVTSYQLEEI